MDATISDPEEDFVIDVTVRVRGFGKKVHRDKMAYRVTKIITDDVGGDAVRVFYDGKLVLYDRYVDDGHAGENYRPWWDARNLGTPVLEPPIGSTTDS